jgi:carboxypeptidase family protein
MKWRVVTAMAIALLAATCAAQDLPQIAKPPKKPKLPTGTITGTVYCADTNLPARGAAIYLLQMERGSNSSRNWGTTDLEGRFAMTKVPEGTYYVVAQFPGYLNPVAELTSSRLQAMSDEERKALESRLASVTVSANQPADVSLRLERAAEIDGTVLYDDGSPAIGLRVHLTPKSALKEQAGFENPLLPAVSMMDDLMRATDDHGRFRILGIPSGEYLVSVWVPTISVNTRTSDFLVQAFPSLGSLVLYAGGSTRANKAQIIKVESGDGTKDADITIPLGKLHTIRGHVVLKSDGVDPPAATIKLLYADTRELARTVMAPNGAFEIHYVPEDSYILQAVASAEPLPELEPDEDGDEGVGIISSSFGFSFDMNTEKSAGGAEIPLVVSADVDNAIVAVPDPPKTKPNGAPESAGEEQPPVSTPQ